MGPGGFRWVPVGPGGSGWVPVGLGGSNLVASKNEISKLCIFRKMIFQLINKINLKEEK